MLLLCYVVLFLVALASTRAASRLRGHNFLHFIVLKFREVEQAVRVRISFGADKMLFLVEQQFSAYPPLPRALPAPSPTVKSPSLKFY